MTAQDADIFIRPYKIVHPGKNIHALRLEPKVEALKRSKINIRDGTVKGDLGGLATKKSGIAAALSLLMRLIQGTTACHGAEISGERLSFGGRSSGSRPSL